MIDMRVTIASAIANALAEQFPHASIEETATTSGCPVIRIRFADRGDAFNLTITRARK